MHLARQRSPEFREQRVADIARMHDEGLEARDFALDGGALALEERPARIVD